MTSLRQIVSNRRNALKSTGPKTEQGKRRSSRNALRHGLTAETVVEAIEYPDDYRAFEALVTAEYNAETIIERELVLRLASLLWRLRRAGALETGLMQIQSDPASSADVGIENPNPRKLHPARLWKSVEDDDGEANVSLAADEIRPSIIEMARCFLQLPTEAFALLGRYEASLWRQVRQTIVALERRNRQSTVRNWRRHASWRDEM